MHVAVFGLRGNFPDAPDPSPKVPTSNFVEPENFLTVIRKLDDTLHFDSICDGHAENVAIVLRKSAHAQHSAAARRSAS